MVFMNPRSIKLFFIIQADLIICKRLNLKICLEFSEFANKKTKDDYKLEDRFNKMDDSQLHNLR
jgi:hypothetical protein